MLPKSRATNKYQDEKIEAIIEMVPAEYRQDLCDRYSAHYLKVKEKKKFVEAYQSADRKLWKAVNNLRMELGITDDLPDQLKPSEIL